MEAIDYCSAMRTEVDRWKTKEQDAFAKFDGVPLEEREKLRPFLSELKAVVEEHTARLEDLSKQCPNELSAPKPKTDRLAEPTLWEDIKRSVRYGPHP